MIVKTMAIRTAPTTTNTAMTFPVESQKDVGWSVDPIDWFDALADCVAVSVAEAVVPSG